MGLLGFALEDHSADAGWWFDPADGDSIRTSEEMPWGEYLIDDPERLVPIEPIPSRLAYADMEDFTARVSDPSARDLPSGRSPGPGRFRRFRDTLHEPDQLREAWSAFHDARRDRRAIAWLRDHRLVDEDQAEAAIEARPDPQSELLAGSFDARAIAAAAAADLRALYGARLREVVLFGSWARGDAHADSDIDLLVVLDQVESRRAERRRMGETLWRHSLANDTVVTAIAAGERELSEADRSILIDARREGELVG